MNQIKSLCGKNVLIIFIILALCAIRFIHLGADSPSQIPTKFDKTNETLSPFPDAVGLIGTGGMYVDEGYKTLSPRNLILFGRTHWNPEDNYPGWMKGSPITQWACYWAFRIFGVDIKSARVVAILCFFFLLSGYAYTMSRCYDSYLFYPGLILLGLQNTIFFFSRIALFEIYLIMFIYSLLFVLKKLDNKKYLIKIALIMLIAWISAFFIKMSALVYILPVLIGTIIVVCIQSNIFQKKATRWYFFIILSIVSICVALFFSNVWLHRVQVSLIGVLKSILFYPPIVTAPIIVIGGLICSLHGLLSQPKAYLGNIYRTSLLSIIFISPIMLACFAYHPTRYYVPILPAYILISLEWFHLKSWNNIITNRIPKLYSLGLLAILCMILFYFAYAFNQYIISFLPFNFGDEPGVSFAFMLKWIVPMTVLLSIIIYWFRKFTFSKVPIISIVSALIILCIFYNSYKVGSFLLKPSYQSRNINLEISKIIPPEASIAGDWAPMFAVNTKIRALYMSDVYNNASNIKKIRPDYFVYTSTIWSNDNMKTIMEFAGVSLGQPVYKSKYIGKDIIIYPVEYED